MNFDLRLFFYINKTNMSDNEDDDYLIMVDDIEYHNYMEGYPPIETISNDELNNFDKIMPKHYNEIPDHREIIFQRDNDKKSMKFYRGVILKKANDNTFIMRNDSIFKIWPFEHNKGWIIYAKNYDKLKEENIKKENLWQLYKAGKVFINEDDI
jgi:hypothetical protein